MKLSSIDYANEDNVADNRQVANILWTRYNEGLRKDAMEDTQDTTNDGSVDIINPVETIKLGKSKRTNSIRSGPKVSQSYSSQKASSGQKNSGLSTSYTAKAKEFLTQSRVFDNELDHMVALMKLNNKEEFFNGGTLLTEEEKEFLQDKATDAEIDDYLRRLLNELQRKEQRGQDTTDTYKKLRYLNHMRSNATDIIKDFGRYDKTDEEDRYVIDDALKRDKKIDSGAHQALKDLTYSINRRRNDNPGKIGTLLNVDKDDVINTYIGANDHLKEKKGIRIVNQTHVKNFGPDLLLSIKKLSNLLTVTLQPLAQAMYDSRYQGMSLNDMNALPILYTDMDEKLYILTSLNNQTNTQLVKLDKDFEKLFNLVDLGLKRYLPPTRSVIGGSMFTYTPVKVHTIYPQLL